LGMPDATLVPEFHTTKEIGPSGREVVTFVVQLNKGMDPRPVAQVASGGEMSRIMLALKVVLAAHDVVQTLVFDEVDQGVGSATGAKIAELLERVAESRQVLVITHLPQIAAMASHHVRITKGERGGMATAEVAVLTGAERVREIARMLGDEADQSLLKHARELLGISDLAPALITPLQKP
jgi:DNA repair protein RecN (Recombination protein N)